MSDTVAELFVTMLADIGIRQKGGTARAAAGWARPTGRLGVCCGTTGPGGTPLVAGPYEARRDHAPVRAISGGASRRARRTGQDRA